MSSSHPWCSCCGSEGNLTICVCMQCMERLLARYRCGKPGCRNLARYDSGLCGLCDIHYNDGQGTKISELIRTERRLTRLPTELDLGSVLAPAGTGRPE